MATGNPTLVVDGLLMYVSSSISSDTPQDIVNVVHDTYNDEAVVLAKTLLWEHYGEKAKLDKYISRRSKYKHVEDIVDGMRKIDVEFSDVVELPVVFVATDMRTLPNVNVKVTTSDSLERTLPNVNVKVSTSDSLESRVKLLEEQMALIRMDAVKMNYSKVVTSPAIPSVYGPARTHGQSVSGPLPGLKPQHRPQIPGVQTAQQMTAINRPTQSM